MPLRERPWLGVIALSAGIGVLSLLTNITTQAQIEGRANALLGARTFVTVLVNSGTVWAGLAVVAGHWVGRAWSAVLAGPLSGICALTTHYALGQASGLMPPDTFGSNVLWFAFALIFGVPLGLIGVLTHRRAAAGTLTRLVVPLGALAEPWVQNWMLFAGPDTGPTPWALRAAGVAMTLAGVVGSWVVLTRRAD